MRRLSAVSFIAAAFIPVAATAQQQCADRNVVTERLTANYGESFAGGGLRNSESIFEVWMSEESGTWTIIMTTPNGLSCVMAAGTDWRSTLPDAPQGIPG